MCPWRVQGGEPACTSSRVERIAGSNGGFLHPRTPSLATARPSRSSSTSSGSTRGLSGVRLKPRKQAYAIFGPVPGLGVEAIRDEIIQPRRHLGPALHPRQPRSVGTLNRRHQLKGIGQAREVDRALPGEEVERHDPQGSPSSSASSRRHHRARRGYLGRLGKFERRGRGCP